MEYFKNKALVKNSEGVWELHVKLSENFKQVITFEDDSEIEQLIAKYRYMKKV